MFSDKTQKEIDWIDCCIEVLEREKEMAVNKLDQEIEKLTSKRSKFIAEDVQNKIKEFVYGN